jgi:uncharacterized membrane protein YgcG
LDIEDEEESSEDEEDDEEDEDEEDEEDDEEDDEEEEKPKKKKKEKTSEQLNEERDRETKSILLNLRAKRMKKVTGEKKTMRRRRAIIVARFSILKTNFPGHKLPEYDIYEDVEILEKKYDMAVKHILAKVNSSDYKVYLMVYWAVIELLCCKVFKIDISGFTKFQMRRMIRYETLLIQLGEKNYLTFMENWPVEAKLAALSLFHAGVFFVIKMASDYLGPSAETIIEALVDGLGSESKRANSILGGGGGGGDSGGSSESSSGGMGDFIGNIMGMMTGKKKEETPPIDVKKEQYGGVNVLEY